jgi:hypothetical protein
MERTGMPKRATLSPVVWTKLTTQHPPAVGVREWTLFIDTLDHVKDR